MFAENQTTPKFDVFIAVNKQFDGISISIGRTNASAMDILKTFDKEAHSPTPIRPHVRTWFDALSTYVAAEAAALRTSGKDVGYMQGYLEYLRNIADAKAALPPATPATTKPTELLEIEASIKNLAYERHFPERAPGESIDVYLAKAYKSITQIAGETVWNNSLDNSAKPYTADPRMRPTFGPIREMELLEHTLIYSADTSNRIKTLGALCDQAYKLIEDPQEQHKAKEMFERAKGLLDEISMWHNRAAIRREHYDKLGPTGAIETYKKYSQGDYEPKFTDLFNKKEMTPEEKKFAESVEFSMSVWAIASLNANERERLKACIDTEAAGFADQAKDIIPYYRSNDERLTKFINDLISKLSAKFGISKTQAQLAYHIGESFRIGAGIEPQLDTKYKTETDPDTNEVKHTVSVASQEGEPKALKIGLYVESAGNNEARPDFNPVFADYLVYGYAPYSRAAQYSHQFRFNGKPFDISGLGDFRSSIAEILAVKGAVDTVDWSSRSSSPDKMVYDAAIQADKMIWGRAQISKSIKPENRYIIDISNIPLSPTAKTDREDEENRLAKYFGGTPGMGRAFVRFAQKASPRFIVPDIASYEQIGFDSDSKRLTGEPLQYLKTLLKDFRDYWLISSFKPDIKRYPGDVVRIMRFLFSRDDRPETNGYVNPKIQGIVEDWHAQPVADRSKWADEVLLPQISGYITYDVLMRSVFFLLSPDLRKVEDVDPQRPQTIKRVYDKLEFQTYENYDVQNRGGTRLVNLAQLAHVINQIGEFQIAFSSDVEEMAKAGYRLYPGNPDQTSVFSRDDVLRLAQSFHLGEGYEYKYRGDVNEWKLRRIPGHPKTIQDLANRIILIKFLFDRESLKLTGKR